jgi:hypothetical protein
VSGLLIYTILVFVFLFAPVALVVLFSFNQTASLTFPFHGFSLRWYQFVLSSPVYQSAIFASLRIGLVTVAVVTVVGTLAGLGLTRYKFRGKSAIRVAILVPALLPGLFIGIALLATFVQLQIPLSLETVTVGHVVYVLPYFFLVANSRLQRFDFMLEESARDLGDIPSSHAAAHRAEPDRGGSGRVLTLVGRGLHHVLHDRCAKHPAARDLRHCPAVSGPFCQRGIHALAGRVVGFHLRHPPIPRGPGTLREAIAL